MRLREVNWLGDGLLEEALRNGAPEVFVKVRSTRPPQAAWLVRGRDGIEVELVGTEEGVAPGQACVFYDAPTGQARVLGGGFIQSAVSASAVGVADAPGKGLSRALAPVTERG
jgi:tRNA-specific 2-thiouridylase